MLDTSAVADILMSFDFVKSNQLCVYGASQVVLALACAILNLELRIMRYVPFLSDYQRVWEIVVKVLIMK